ncbi:MAG TPA: tetratricopeptide repeat protein [Thermoanaerobaculia bacterium]|nr:tetratricopeptide repeat protein [Thermoanaerobaculia bacterium]
MRHLLARCPRCVEAASGIARRENLVSGAQGPGSPLPAVRPELYDPVFEKVFSGIEQAETRLAREKLRSIGQWSSLEGHPQARRLVMIRNDKRLHNWALYERLLEEGRQVERRDPAAAVDFAELALAVVDSLDPENLGEERLADFRATALAALGNARRLAKDFEGAREAFREAWKALEEGSDDPFEQAGLVSREANLLCDLGEFDKAAQLLERALALYREGGDLHFQGRTLLQQALLVGYEDPEKGVDLAEEALALIDAVREPRLELCARHNLTWFLNDNGQVREAMAMLEMSRNLYSQFADAWTRILLHWLEGRITRSLGDLPEAEHTFKGVWKKLHQRGFQRELALLTVDLVEVYAQQGKFEEATGLVDAFYPLLEEWGMHTEGLSFWRLLREALTARSVESGVFRRTSIYYRRAWRRPMEG